MTGDQVRPALLPEEFSDAVTQTRDRLGRLGTQFLFYPVIGSTNDIALGLTGDAGAEGAVVFADAQTEGRGRRGRRWISPPSGGLYVSIVLTPSRAAVDPERATSLVTLAAGVALAEAVETQTGLSPHIKWPNDLFIGPRKVAGILAERSMEDGRERVVLGYGINVGPMVHDPSLGDRATSLDAELGRPVARAEVFAETLATLAARYDDLLAGRFDAILDAWRGRAPGSRGAKIVWHTPGGHAAGVTAGIDAAGALLVDVDGRLERILGGELTWI